MPLEIPVIEVWATAQRDYLMPGASQNRRDSDLPPAPCGQAKAYVAYASKVARVCEIECTEKLALPNQQRLFTFLVFLKYTTWRMREKSSVT
jgi:hypothetical protein